ncbi:MAG: TatD family hydrolase [Sedimentisphaerales bacterium]|nr:TatD family hydrolase [Sedimentisphaerales bacterium]
MELIDTHCHLTFEGLNEDVAAVIERSRAAGVTGWITVGTDSKENQKVIELAEKFENMYAAVGIHPHEARTVTADTLKELRALAQSNKVVAIGETGLDYHYNFSSREEQRTVFGEHLKIAAELNLPVVIHSREAFEETMEILGQYSGDVKKIVFHCFSGDTSQAKIILDRGFYISFTGAVTFKNAEKIRQAAEVVPLDRLMIETDAPYMSPEPMRKQKINEPALMVHTAKRLAELKGMSLADFAEAVTATSKTFFFQLS